MPPRKSTRLTRASKRKSTEDGDEGNKSEEELVSLGESESEEEFLDSDSDSGGSDDDDDDDDDDGGDDNDDDEESGDNSDKGESGSDSDSEDGSDGEGLDEEKLKGMTQVQREAYMYDYETRKQEREERRAAARRAKEEKRSAKAKKGKEKEKKKKDKSKTSKSKGKDKDKKSKKKKDKSKSKKDKKEKKDKKASKKAKETSRSKTKKRRTSDDDDGDEEEEEFNLGEDSDASEGLGTLTGSDDDVDDDDLLNLDAPSTSSSATASSTSASAKTKSIDALLRSMRSARSREGYSSESESEDEGASAERRNRRRNRARGAGGDDDDDDILGSELKLDSSSSSKAAAAQEKAERKRRAREATLMASSDYSSAESMQLSDTLNLQLRRTAVEKLCAEPYFADYVTGLYVRVADKNTGEGTHYRCVEVLGLKEVPKAYQVGKHSVRRALQVRQGGLERLYPMTVISNQSITEAEWDKFKKEAEKARQYIPSARRAAQMRVEKEVMRKQFQYTPELLAKTLEEQRKERLIFTNFLSEKIRLEAAIEAAQAALDAGNGGDDSAAAAKLKAARAELALLQRAEEERESRRIQALSIQGGVSVYELNERTRQQNMNQISFEEALASGEVLPSHPSYREETLRVAEANRARREALLKAAGITDSSSVLSKSVVNQIYSTILRRTSGAAAAPLDTSSEGLALRKLCSFDLGVDMAAMLDLSAVPDAAHAEYTRFVTPSVPLRAPGQPGLPWPIQNASEFQSASQEVISVARYMELEREHAA